MENSSLLGQLGIEGKLLLAQGINFLILVIVLRFAVYKPLLSIVAKRKKRIEEGLAGAEEAEKRLAAIDEEKKKRLTEAEKEAMGIISSAENNATGRAREILGDADKKAEGLLAEAAKIREQQRKESLTATLDEAQSLIKDAITKTVELSPEAIDEKLIVEAIGKVKSEKIA